MHPSTIDRPQSEEPERLPPAAEATGIAWWNRLSEAERAYWLHVADSARPVDAYAAYCRHPERNAAADKRAV